MEATAGAWCEGILLRFRVPDVERVLAGVSLFSSAFRAELSFRPESAAWEYHRERPPLHRLEYRLELLHRDGRRVSEPGELRCPGYREPDWLRLPRASGRWRRIGDARIWSPLNETAGEPLRETAREPRQEPRTEPAHEPGTDRILVVHDGPEYQRAGGLLDYTAAVIRDGRVPPYHLVLLPPGNRDADYSASPAYARTLAREILPRIRARLGGARVVGAGASLGALAMLHAQRRFPETFAGLFLQSGSYFQPRYDGTESGFRYWPRIVRFVYRVRHEGTGPAIPATLTCGAAEENLANNRDMADALRKQGYPLAFVENPDAHTWTGWRDALHPHLTDLLRRVWPD